MANFFAPVKRAQEVELFFDSLIADMDLSPEQISLLRAIIVDTAYQAATDEVTHDLIRPYLHFYNKLSSTIETREEEISGVGISHKVHVA